MTIKNLVAQVPLVILCLPGLDLSTLIKDLAEGRGNMMSPPTP